MRLAVTLVVCATSVEMVRAEIVNVDVRNNFYRVVSPVPGQGTNICTINRGDTVRWTWFGNVHSVLSDHDLFWTLVENVPFAYEHTFNEVGVFGYYCIVHGSPGLGMWGAVNVVAPPCPGDLNGNNSVDLDDLTTLLSNYGTASGATVSDGDMNADGAVDLDDLSLMLGYYGASC